jgi:hypothetical protein
MKTLHTTAAFYGALLAASLPAFGDEAPAAIIPAWEVHADLSGDGLPTKLREVLFPNAAKLGRKPSIAVKGFNNSATKDDDWLVSLEVPGKADELWEKLQRDFKDEWGAPDESGRWTVNDPESGDTFVIAKTDKALQFTNAAENLTVALASGNRQPTAGRAIHGHVNLQASGADKAGSELFRLTDKLAFSAGSSGSGMVLEITVDLMETPEADQIEKAVRKALKSDLLDQLAPVLPKPAVSRKSSESRESFTFTMNFNAEQTDRAISTVLENLMAGEPERSPLQTVPDTDGPDAKDR